MKYTKEERIDIGRQVFTHELSRAEALSKYGIVKSCLDRYIHDYKVANDIPTETRAAGYPQTGYITSPGSSIDIEAYKAMSKEELINELIISAFHIKGSHVAHNTLQRSCDIQSGKQEVWVSLEGVTGLFIPVML